MVAATQVRVKSVAFLRHTLDFYRLLIGVCLSALFLSAISFIVAMQFLPEMHYFVTLAYLGFVIHATGFAFKEYSKGELRDDRGTSVDALLMIVILGIYFNTAILGSAVLAGTVLSGMSAAAMAFYLPAIDNYLLRRFSRSPAIFVVLAALLIGRVMFGIKNIDLRSVPLLGSKRFRGL
jgi:hypothetical protein